MVFFSFPWIIRIFMDVEHYIENNNWIYLAWFGEKTLKSGLYFYENCPPVKIISRSLSSVQDSVHGFITQLRKGNFGAELPSCPPVKIISRSLSSVQDSVHGFITQLQKRYFLYPWVIEISSHVEHYWEN